MSEDCHESGGVAMMTKRKYLDWAHAGGPNECKHGYAKGIPCPRCDEESGQLDCYLPQVEPVADVGGGHPMTDMEAVIARYPDAYESGLGYIWEYRGVTKVYPMREPLGKSWADARARIEPNPVEAEER